MKSLVRPELPTASVGSSQAPTAAVDNSAPLATRPQSTYKSGFAVQISGATSDGRPMDFIAAMLIDQLGDEIQWLSIREFADLAANTASQAHAVSEQQGLRDLIKVPATHEVPDPKDRWDKTGGPI